MRRSRGTARRPAPEAGSDRAAARSAPAGDRADHEDRDDRADRRNDDGADIERAVDRLGVEEDTGEESADERADDAQDDVSDDTEALVTLDEEPGEIPGDRAKDDPRNDAHSYLHPSAGLSTICWGPLVYPEVRDIGAQCRPAGAPG